MTRPRITHIVLLLLLAAVVYLFVQNHSLSNRIDSLGIDEVKTAQAVSSANASAQGQSQKVIATPEGNFVYIPELRLKLPYDPVSKYLAYGIRSDGTGEVFRNNDKEADVTSSRFTPPAKPTRMDCSALARIKIEDKSNAYSPHEKPSSVKLADGRTLWIYEPTGLDECETAWSLSASPSPAAVAAEFQKAQSY
jgi:hypothetical protein